jgi:hypothetical protein
LDAREQNPQAGRGCGIPGLKRETWGTMLGVTRVR